MKKGKWIAMLLCCLMTFGAAGCGGTNNSKPTPPPTPSDTDKFPYWQTETDRKTDGQLYAPEGVEFPASLWSAPAAERCESLDKGDIKAYFIDSVAGTKVFCYVGIPENASSTNKVPGVVLVHGATGTAFYDWVQMWVEKGYAAVAMDTEGHMPTAQTSLFNAVMTESSKKHGPANAAFTDSKKAVNEQWVYHALASVIASASFLMGFEEVDTSRVGITGVSYGGFLTCLAAGYDDRYVFAAPVYGCLSNSEGAGEFGRYINSNQGAALWDNTGALAASHAPFLFVNGNVDFHFTLDAMARSAAACKQSALCIKDRMVHGHSQGADVTEVFAFADEICKGGTPLVHVVKVNKDNGELQFAVHKNASIKRVRQFYTPFETLNSTTEWERETAEWEDDWAFFSVDADKKHWYIEIEDDSGRIVTCPVA